MGPPPVTVYLTTIASQPALRKRQELLLRILQAKRIPFKSYDLASDEEAKKLWRRRAPAGKEQLPGILVGGKFVGTFQEFEEAVEFDELNQFLKRNEEWDESLEVPSLPTQPIGVPGAHTPMEMTPERIKAKVLAGQPSPDRKTPVPTPVNKEPLGFRMSVGGELGGFGLDGVKVTHDELRDLVAQLGMGGDDAEDLIQGLGDSGDKPRRSSKEPVSVKPSAIVKAQPKPLAPLRPKASRASSLNKEKAKEATTAPPTPNIEDIPTKNLSPPSPKAEVVFTQDPSPPSSKVAEQPTAEVEKAPEPSQPVPAKPVEQAPPTEKEPEPTTAVPPPVINEPVEVQERSWQPSPPDNAPEAIPQEETPRELPPIRVQDTVRRMPSNRSEDTLAVDFGSPTSNADMPYSPLTPRTLVGEQEATKSLLFKSEPVSTPTMSEAFHEKSEEAEQKESQGFKAILRRLFCM